MGKTMLIGAAVAAAALAVAALAQPSAETGGMMGQGMMGHGMMGESASEPDGEQAGGEKIFQDNCSSCHTVIADEGSGLGPNLHGLFGRHAGTLEGFGYSAAMQSADVVWSAKTLDIYLTDPAKFVPGNRMPFVGIKDDKQRHALIAYLAAATK
ncbi:MAG: c-type cytochrome [Alphaproteobacteria bacterium]|nr:c-type cytochrome [Alphaproteobacteria bacterium]